MDQKLYPINEALLVACNIIEAIKSTCHRIEIAGSIRRKKPMVHDIDLVAWPIYENETVKDLFGFQLEGSQPTPYKLFDALQVISRNPKARIITIQRNQDDIPLEIYLAEPDGSNYGALLQMRTGSAEFNIKLASRAKRMGIHYKAGYGLFDKDGRRSDDGDYLSELGIFKRLGLEFIPPEERV